MTRLPYQITEPVAPRHRQWSAGPLFTLQDFIRAATVWKTEAKSADPREATLLVV